MGLATALGLTGCGGPLPLLPRPRPGRSTPPPPHDSTPPAVPPVTPGQVYGFGAFGFRGSPRTPSSLGLSDVVAIDCGYDTSRAAGDRTSFSARPVHIAGLPPMTDVAVNDHGVLALSRSGEVWWWGSDEGGLSGTGTSHDRVAAPMRLPHLPKIGSVSAGGSSALALSLDGRVFSWGFGASGQGRLANTLPVGQVQGLPAVVAMSCGKFTSLALTRDGSVWQWGSDESGGLGDGQTRSPGRVAVRAERAPSPRRGASARNASADGWSPPTTSCTAGEKGSSASAAMDASKITR